MFDLAYSIIITVTFSCPEFASAHKQSAQFTKSMLRYSRFLEHHELKKHAHFDHAHSLIIEVIFSFPEFVSACTKISLFHQFLLEIEPVLEFSDQSGLTHFYYTHPNIFQSISFNFHEFESNMQKIRPFKKSCNLIGQEHFGNIPNMGIVQIHSELI